METRTTTIRVSQEAARVYNSATAELQRKLEVLLSLKLTEVARTSRPLEEIMDEIRKTQCEGYKIAVLGKVTEEEKWDLLSRASCFAHPSHYEGFGFPVLEAMAAGVPVVCSNSSSLPEVAGEAAMLNDPNDIKGFASKISQALMDQKTADDLRTKGRARAAKFGWERTARRTLEVYGKFSA